MAASDDNRLRESLSERFADVPVAWRGVTDPFHHGAAGQELVRFVDKRVAEGATDRKSNV